jgi:GT2 family glycosyltransferase
VRFSLLIATLGRADALRDTLASVGGCDPQPDEVIVVDADARRSARLPAEEAGARYVTAERGLTRQRNRGLREATGDVVVFVDDDVRVRPDLFARLEEAYSDPDVVGVTGRVIEPDAGRIGGPGSALRLLAGKEGTFTSFGYPRYLRDGSAPRDVEYMLGCFMTARRDAALEVGFDEHLPGYGVAEDEDFSYRLSRRGRIRYFPEIVVEHEKLGFGERDARVYDRQVVVNRAYLFRKNFAPTPIARVQFGLLVAGLVAHRIVNREWRGAQGLVEGAVDAWRRRR